MRALTEPVEFLRQAELLREHGDNPSGYLTLNRDNTVFTVPGIDGFIAYRAGRRHWIQFSGPIVAPADATELLSAFMSAADSAGATVTAVQLQPADTARYAELGFTINQLGSSYALQLADFTLRGKRFLSLRNKVSRAHRSGLEISEVDADAHSYEIEAVDRSWLRSKGWHVKQLEFMVGETGGPAQQRRRLFLGSCDNRPQCYLSYSPVYGSRPGWLYDLSRRRSDAPPGVLEAVNMHAIALFQQEGADWLHFGFTPFAGLDPRHALPTASPVMDRLMRFLAAHGEFVYPARTQVDYKQKWYPQDITPEYLAFQKGISMSAVWRLLRITRAV